MFCEIASVKLAYSWCGAGGGGQLGPDGTVFVIQARYALKSCRAEIGTRDMSGAVRARRCACARVYERAVW